MKLLDYYNNVVLVTLNQSLGNKLNKAHMALGFSSEIMSELTEANFNNDSVNELEELGDAEYFVVGLAHFYNIPIYSCVELNKKYNYIVDKYFTVESVENELFFVDKLLLIKKLMGDLDTIVKKEITSDVIKLNGVLLSQIELEDIFYKLLYVIELFVAENYSDNGHDIYMVREMNSVKLVGVRHKEGFTVNTDLERDLKSEREVMEQVMSK